MNTQIFQIAVMLASAYIALDTTLYWAVILIYITIAPLLPREPLWAERENQKLPRFLRKGTILWITLNIQRIVFFFPMMCMIPIFRWSSRLHRHNPVHFHRLVWVCSIDLFLASIWSAWFHNGSLLAWGTCLFWLFIIDQLVEHNNTDGPENNNGGDEPDEPDPTPNGDAVEQWLQSLQKVVAGRH